MRKTLRANDGRTLFTLVRGKKYTRLYCGFINYTWTNETIDDILGDYDKQIEHFKENLSIKIQ